MLSWVLVSAGTYKLEACPPKGESGDHDGKPEAVAERPVMQPEPESKGGPADGLSNCLLLF